ARELHPDLNPGDRRSEDRFKEISAAYDFLSDPAKRAQFDAGEIDATGATKRRSWRSQGAGPGAGRRGGSPFGDNVDDILSELLRRKERGRAQSAGRPFRGADIRHSLTVPFIEAAAGGSRRVTLISGKTVEVRIPPGSTDGQTLRLKGQGSAGDGDAGDAFIDLKVESHPFFTRRELDILVDLPISVQEAVLGGKVTVPTVHGKVTLSVPPGSNTGTVLRLKGKGIAGPGGIQGDQLVVLKVLLPDRDGEFKALVEKWGPRHGYDPRIKAGMA
ncbi:MAG: J domain-containing protein, partial [Magnetospirillum sp.]